MSCFRYELKNCFFKRSSHVVCNFINICKTLAYRHQHNALFSVLSNRFKRNCYIVGKSECSSPNSLRNGLLSELICTASGIAADENIVVAYKLQRDSVEVHKGHCVVIDTQDDELVFGQVECFICKMDDENWYVIATKLETVSYVEHFHSYAVREASPRTYSVLQFCDLLDRHPVCRYTMQLESRRVKFCRLPYWVA